MQGTKKELTISIGKSTLDSDHRYQSWWSPTQSHHQESALSTRSDLNMGVPSQRYQSEKMLSFSFQDQDTSSTQSTGQSYSKVSNVEENNLDSQRMFLTPSGYHLISAKQEGTQIQYPQVGGQNYNSSHLQADCPQSFAQLAATYSDQFFNGVLSSYGPQALVMGVMPARVPLPLDFSTEPIYVNPKQYHGILRRRQFRAKLEAQNKLVKNRKPYLHESRHQHALKRVRGTGGRFLNSKKVQPSKPTTSATNGQDISGSVQLHLAPIRSGSQIYQQENRRDGTSTTSCSDITSTSTSDDIYHPLDFSFSSYPSRGGGTMLGGGNYI